MKVKHFGNLKTSRIPGLGKQVSQLSLSYTKPPQPRGIRLLTALVKEYLQCPKLARIVDAPKNKCKPRCYKKMNVENIIFLNYILLIIIKI